MKLKAVCELTGLSRKTIRLYEEKGLLVPRKTRSNGRDYREYTEADVEKLKTIATLRKAWFTMEEIHRMQEDPAFIREVLPQYYQWLKQQKRELDSLLTVAGSIQQEQPESIEALAQCMSEAAEKLSLPAYDIRPRFKYLDEIEEVRNMKPQEESKTWQAPLEGGIKDDRVYRQFVAATSKTNDDNLAVAFGQLHEATALAREDGPVSGKRKESRLVRWMSRVSGIIALLGLLLLAVMVAVVYLDIGFGRSPDISAVMYTGLGIMAAGLAVYIAARGIAAYQERQRWLQVVRQQEAEKQKKE